MATNETKGKLFKEFCPITTLDELNSTLEKYGIAVLPNVFTEQECEALKRKVFFHLKKTFNVVEPDDYVKLRPMLGYMMKSFGISFLPEILEMKTDERVVNAFRAIWNEQDLTTSFDAIAIVPPPEKRSNPVYFDETKTWFHTDQSSDKKGMHCVQSFINLDETGEGDGCLSVLVDSHRYHAEFFERFNESSRGTDWFRLDQRAHLDWYMREKKCEWAMIQAPKGSMVFWDSRLIHMGTAPRQGRPNPDRWRFIAYVCYTPARLQSNSDKEFKKMAYANQFHTSHWPYGLTRDDDNFECDESIEGLSPRQKKLFGID